MAIVWAEDEDGDRLLIRSALEESGRSPKVRFARDGREALAAVTQKRPRLVVLDINMPGVDGIEALRRLRADEATREVPVAIFSTSGSPHDLAECRRLGVVDFVRKPLDFDHFKGAVGRILDLVQVARVAS